MRSLFLVLALTLPTLFFGQTINDVVNFNSLNRHLINDIVINRIIKQREYLKVIDIVKDTVPMLHAKYQNTYFEMYGDQNEINNPENVVIMDLRGKNWKQRYSLSTPEQKLIVCEGFIHYPDTFVRSSEYKHRLISEKSISIIIENKNFTYSELIQRIIDEFLDDQHHRNVLFNDMSSEKKYLGVDCGLYIKDNQILFNLTYVITKKVN